MKTRICIIGASGRMGLEIARAAIKAGAQITGAVEYAGSPKNGMDFHILAGFPSEGCLITDNILAAAANADVLVDFSGADGTHANREFYKKAAKPLVVGSTGLTGKNLADIHELAKDIPLLVSANMSMGVNLMAKLVELAAEILNADDFDVEIFEAHHKHKKDAPSGTALLLAKAAAKGRKINLEENAVYAREGITGERVTGTIGFQVLRGGSIPGDHTVFFCGDGERIEITHRAESRENFAKGAIKAAFWIKNKKAGLYSINEMMGL